jgi:4-carboxymuconolactone decarboxylase
MKLAALVIMTLISSGVARAQSKTEQPVGKAAPAAQPARASASGALQQKLAPGLAKYTNEVLFGEVWPAPELSPRDRSLTVISILIATNKPGQLRGHLTRALSNGVTPVEAAGVLTHLAFYAGWPSAVSALEIFDAVYTEQNVDFAALQIAMQPLSPAANAAAEADAVTTKFGVVAPKFADITNRVVVNDLWRRSDLSVRDRSLVTIAALAGIGGSDLLEPYLRRGVEAGLSRDQIAEVLTHLGFYAGWGKATKALEVVTRTLGAEAPR